MEVPYPAGAGGESTTLCLESTNVLHSEKISLISKPRMSNTPKVATLAELDALVGEHVVMETPELHWEDSHGTFQFETEAEARNAIHDPYYQNFLPDVDWAETIVRQVRTYRAYATDIVAFWRMVAAVSESHGALKLTRDCGQWCAGFGKGTECRAHSPQIAVCLAALKAQGLKVDVDHARIERQLGIVLGVEESGNPEL